MNTVIAFRSVIIKFTLFSLLRNFNILNMLSSFMILNVVLLLLQLLLFRLFLMPPVLSWRASWRALIMDDVFLPLLDEPPEDYDPIADYDPWSDAVCRAADEYYLSLGESSYDF